MDDLEISNDFNDDTEYETKMDASTSPMDYYNPTYATRDYATHSQASDNSDDEYSTRL